MRNLGRNTQLSRKIRSTRFQNAVLRMENRHNESDPLTDFLQEVKERAHYHYWLFGHYHDNRSINEKYILLWEQIVQVI